MNTYAVTASRLGTPLTSLVLTAADALAAIEQAEQALRLKVQEYHISEKAGAVRLVQWTGVEFTARRVN